jgi:hypothetical protein
MRYMIVDESGSTRASFGSFDELVEALRDVERRSRGAAANLYVETYEDGRPVGEIRGGDDVLDHAAVVSPALVLAVAAQSRAGSTTQTVRSLAFSRAHRRSQVAHA